MARILILHAEIDDAAPLGPQLKRLNARGVPWKVLAQRLGYSERHLRRLAEEAQKICECPKYRTDARRTVLAH